MLGRKIQTLLEVSREAKHPLLVGTVILVFLSIFTKCQASSPVEAMKRHLLWCMELPTSDCDELDIPPDLRRVSQGISGVASRKSSHLSCMM